MPEASSTPIRDPNRRPRIVIIGGGFSGVEVAGELSGFLAKSQRWYRHSQLDPARVVIVDGGPHLLPELPERLGRFTERKLSRHGGVEVRLGIRSEAIDARGVELNKGSRIDAGTVVSTIGTTANRLIEALTLGFSTSSRTSHESRRRSPLGHLPE